jgi:anaerobic selenocysteine-containing dehydrogenase
MNTMKQTFCRICEPNCPVSAEIDSGGKVIALQPVRDHPSGGLACHKGLSYLEVHNDPERANWPQKRMNPKSDPQAEFARLDWDTCLRDIGSRLKEIRDRHGANAIAAYHGNPISRDSAGVLSYEPFLNAVGTNMRFGGATQDMANKTTGAAYVYGSTGSFMIPDLRHTDYLLCIGTNPKVSRWTLMSQPQDNMDVTRRIVERGGKVCFVNPRRTESSTAETGPTLQIKPGADAYFLAALLREIDLLGGIDDAVVAARGKSVEELLAFVAPYGADRVASVTGIAPEELRQVAADICAASSAGVYMATGVNQSGQGLLCYWLSEMINFVTGNLGRQGGTYKPTGLVDGCPPMLGVQEIETTLGPLRLPDPVGYCQLPAAVLPDLIENGDIRALILWSGNPLITVAGEDRMRAAFQKLELLVSIDIYRSVSGEVCDYVLPVTDWLERADINVTASGMQAVPYVQYTEAMETPTDDRRDAWWILARIGQEMGLESPLDANADAADATFLFDRVLLNKGLSVEALKQRPWNTELIPEEDRSALFDRCLKHPDGRVDCFPPAFAEAGLLERFHETFDTLSHEPADTLKLIGLRTPHMHNSWLANIPVYRRGQHGDNPLHMCEEDAVKRGFFDGDLIEISTDYGRIEARLLIDDTMRPGVVAMTHGYGNKRAVTMRTAAQKPGVNCNILMPSGVGTYEPLSFMSWLSGVPVRVQGLTRNPEELVVPSDEPS